MCDGESVRCLSIFQIYVFQLYTIIECILKLQQYLNDVLAGMIVSYVLECAGRYNELIYIGH